MKLSRADFVPLLTIVAGVALGASLSFNFLLLSRSDDVPVTLGLLYESSATLESATRVAARVGTVTGRVTEASGQPIAAAQVFISSLDLGGLTQRNGRYLIPNVPAGPHTLSVSRIGYRTTEAQITIGGGQTVEQNFSVSEEALQLDAIIVTGTPGCIQRRAIGGFSSIAIGNQPLIYIDGIRVDNSFGLGPDDQVSGFCGPGGSEASALDDINPNDIESIEIIKGPAAATLYGTGASAGVIQITLKEDRPGR